MPSFGRILKGHKGNLKALATEIYPVEGVKGGIFISS